VTSLRWEQGLLRLCAGMHVVPFVGVCLSLSGLRSGWGRAGLLVALAVLPWLSRGRFPGGAMRQRVWPGLSRARVPVFLWPLVLIGVVTLGPAICYPTAWDELVYHVVLPRRWHADGFVAFYPDVPYSGFPSLAEIGFWMMAPIECLIAPKLLNWVCWMLGLILLCLLIRSHLPQTWSGLLVAAFAVSPATLMVSADCYVESMLLMDVAALLVAVSQPAGRCGVGNGRGDPWVMGVLAGGAAAVKLTGLVALTVPLLWSAGSLWGGRSRSPWSLRGACLATAVGVGLAGPFYVRAYLATGNPFYPYFCEWFTSDPSRVAMSAYHHVLGGATFGSRDLWSLFTAPIMLAFRESLYDGRFGWQLLLLLALAAAGVVTSIRRGHLGMAAWPLTVAAALYLFWFVSAQQARFAVSLVAVVTLLGAIGFRGLNRRTRRWTFAGLLALAIVSLPWPAAGLYFGSWETVLGLWTWTEYVDDGTRSRYVPLLQALAKVTPPDARLMLLNEHRGLYMPRVWRIGTPYFQEQGLSPPEELHDAAKLVDVLERSGITHLVAATSSQGPDRSREWWDRLTPLYRGLDEAVRRGALSIVWQNEDYLVFEVRTGASTGNASDGDPPR
jgi:hypothetical protein